MSSTKRQMVLRLTDEEYEVLERFRAQRYEQFIARDDHVLAFRGGGHEVYVEKSGGVNVDPPQLEVVAAVLNGLVQV